MAGSTRSSSASRGPSRSGRSFNMRDITGQIDRNLWPGWVRVPLLGVPTRHGAMNFVLLCNTLAICAAIAAMWHPYFAAGLVFLLAGWWYWAAARGVARNGGW